MIDGSDGKLPTGEQYYIHKTTPFTHCDNMNENIIIPK